MSASEALAHWIRLERTHGVGPETGRRLLAAFGLPENIFSAAFQDLCNVVAEPVARALHAAPSDALQTLIERTLAWAEQPGNHVFTLADTGYPNTLLNIADPPLLLYARGQLALLAQPAIAIVGSRNASAQGNANAQRFAEALSHAGLGIVSGLALGIDTAAHRGALQAHADGGAGSTIAVIGTGADLVYPARNRALADQIAQAGCILSEYALGMPPVAANFPRRNRIISGLSCGVLVVEAAAQSGSLITARMALEQGRDVFAIPGSIHSPLAKGCHQLIRQGAKLVESAQHVLEELGHYQAVRPAPQPVVSPVCAGPAARLLAAIGFDPVDPDLLAERVGLDAATISAQLLALEMEGWVELLPGGSYRRLA